ncbi:hypothetical protein HK102_007932 [Quaeritorhiza haematococci]|nr:hypothetical protein HK102_007932 [Quaeritorhiza haematococci]
MTSTTSTVNGAGVASLTPDQLELIKQDRPNFARLLRELQTKVSEVRKARVQGLSTSVSQDEVPTTKGVSLLEVKLHTLLSYITNLSFYMLLKVNGHRLEDHPVVDKLVEARVFLEKMKPLEQKLKYQIDKLVKAAVIAEQAESSAGRVEESRGRKSRGDGEGGEESLTASGLSDPLKFKPNPMNLVAGKDNEAETGTDSGTGVYRPPKLAPTFFDDGSSKSRAAKLTQRQMEKAQRSRLMNELRAQFDERPEEMTAEGTGYGAREVGNELDDRWTEREQYEEENFVRLNLSREDKKARKAILKRGGLMRFQNEFQNLEQDFASLSDVSRVVDTEDRQELGKGVLRKRKMRAAEMFEGGEGDDAGASGSGRMKKGKYKDAGHLLQSVSRAQARHMGKKTGFDKELKKMKKQQKKGGD